MKLVKRLLGLSPSSAKPKQKINQLSAADVVAIAQGESYATYTIDELSAAVAKLAYGPELVSIASKDGKLQRAALLNIANTLESGGIALAQLRQDIPDLKQQLSVTSFCKNSSLTETLLAELSSEEELVKLCEQTPSSHLRLQLVQKITSETNLKKLEKSLKTKDKSCYKIVRQKLDTLKEQAAEQQAILDGLSKLEEDLSMHAQRGFNKDYKFKLDSMIRRKSTLAEKGSSQWNNDMDELIKQCAVVAESNANQQDDTAEIDIPIDNSPTNLSTGTKESDISNDPKFEAVIAKFDAVIDRYCQISKQFLSNCFEETFIIETVLNELQLVNDEWDALTDTSRPSEEQIQNKTLLTEAVSSVIFTLMNNEALLTALKNLNNDALAETTIRNENRALIRFKSPLTSLKIFQNKVGSSALCDRIKEREEKIKRIEQAEKDKHRQIEGLIRKASNAVREGHLKRAHGIGFSITELIEACKRIPPHIERQSVQLQQEIEKLGDWHSFAVTPKLEVLVSQMEALASSPVSAELQATKIHKLQEEWKSISKGGGNKYQELWEKFKLAADTAYEPCKQHFQQLDTERQRNLEKRDELIKQLDDYINSYNWASADWAQVENLLRSAKKEWQSYSPVKREQQREQQQAFNLRLDAIQAKLNEEYSKNRAEKERLINGLESLVDSSELENAINIAIRFQKQWKLIGRCHHKDESRLWKQFRSHCDAIFAKRDAERDAAKSKVDKLIADADGLILELQALLDLDTQDFEKRYREIDEIKARFNTPDEIPKSRLNSLQNRMRKVSDSLDMRFKKTQQERRESVWEALFSIKCEINSALLQSDSTRLESLLAKLNQLSSTPGQCQKILIKLSENASPPSPTEAEQAYRLTCIKAEIASDTETPETDKALRMTYQVGQLQAGQGKQSQSQLSLAEEWFAISPIEDSAYNSLNTRFLECWKRI